MQINADNTGLIWRLAALSLVKMTGVSLLKRVLVRRWSTAGSLMWLDHHGSLPPCRQDAFRIMDVA